MAEPQFEKLRVVIIDDNQHMRTLLHAMMSGLGFHVVRGEENGKAGFEAIQNLKPDLVVTDYAMEPMDGVQLVKKVRALQSPLAYVPIIMITGHNELSCIERARDAGVTEFLCKPITARDLYLRIREVIERPRLFVKAPEFTGPDRRRKRLPAWAVPKRRQSDFDVELEMK